MKSHCRFLPRWLCPFRRPNLPALISAPKAARRDFDVARARLNGAALDTVDTAEFAVKGAIEARDRVREAGDRAARSAEDSPIMRAVNDAARQVSDHAGNPDEA